MMFDFLFSKRNFLVKKFNPIVFNSNVNFSGLEQFSFDDVSDEFLDKSDFDGVVFSRFDNVCFNYDKGFYDDLNVRNFILNVPAKFYGREFAKSCSFFCESELVLEVLVGSGFILLESINTSDINIVKVNRGDFVVVPDEFSFVLINSSLVGDFGVFGLLGKNVELDKLVLKKFNGANLFYTKSGFVKNLNSKSNYILKNFEGDFIGDTRNSFKEISGQSETSSDSYIFDKELGLYKEVLRFPEKFNFLK